MVALRCSVVSYRKVECAGQGYNLNCSHLPQVTALHRIVNVQHFAKNFFVENSYLPPFEHEASQNLNIDVKNDLAFISCESH